MTSKPPVKIGFAAPFTGDQAIVGAPMRQCAALAIAQANEQGHLPFELSLQAEDDQADPTQAQAVARKFVADAQVIGVVGHKNSGPSAAAASIYAAAGLAQITPSSTNSLLSRQGFKTFFRMCAHDGVQGQVAAQYAVRVLGARRVAVIHDQTDYGRPLAEVVQATVEQEQAEVVLFEGIAEGQTDFSDTVRQIQQLGPDMVYFALTEIESSILARQIREAGLATLLFGTDGSKESQFLPLAGPAAEGVYQTYAGVDPERLPAAQSFVQTFQARYGPVPVYGAEVSDTVNVFVAALERVAERSRPAILEQIVRTQDLAGITGSINFEINGDRRDPQVSIWRVEQGQMRLLGLAQALIPAKPRN